MTLSSYKAAAVQAAPVFMNLDQSVEKAIDLIGQASRQDARLIAFPETWLPGYPWFIWLGAPAYGLQFVPQYHANSLRLDSPQMARLCETARKNEIHVLIGYSEKDGGSLYMGQSLIGADGEIIFSRRKLKPTHVERSLFGESDGSSFRVAETDCGRIGALCCWEHLQPLSKYAMYALHEEVHCASWPSFTLYRDLAYALGPEANLAASQVYALEGQCFVLHSTAVTSQEMFDLLCDTPDKAQLLNPRDGRPGGGFSMIFGPDGRPLADALPEMEEGLILADIDLSAISVAKAAADPVGHYSRPDVVRLLVNRRPMPPVMDFEDAPSPAGDEDRGDPPVPEPRPVQAAEGAS